MPKEKKERQRIRPWQQRTIRIDPPPPKLPKQSLEPTTKTPNTLSITVRPRPAFEGGKGLTWVVEERPEGQVGTGQLIKLRRGEEETGIGQANTIVDLRRHWVTWEIKGGQTSCRLRVPIPWARLNGIEGVAHTSHYKTLPNTPPPHPAFAENPMITNEEDSPYEFDVTEKQTETLTRRLREITTTRERQRINRSEDRKGEAKRHEKRDE